MDMKKAESKFGFDSAFEGLFYGVVFYNSLLASSDSSLRSPLTRFTWAKMSCPFILSIM